MSSVHYKFKATLEYKTLTFDGLHIGVDELKKAICDKENIRTESFDLLLINAHTKREYTAGELVPRNSSVVVQRVPRENAQKLPKVQDTSTSGMVQRGIANQPQKSYIHPDEFAKMTEEQKLAHIKQVSTEKYSTANYQKRPTRIMEGPPPPTYVCNRCAQPGHWYKNCPLVNTRKTTGIPMAELMETTQDDPNAMLHPSGRFVKPIMHHQARLHRKHEPFPGHLDESNGTLNIGGEKEFVVPEQYKCNLCKGLLRDAVLAACCGYSFCAECYQQKLLANPMVACPGPECSQQISADSLIPNKSLRAAIQKYLNEIRNGVEPSQTTHPAIYDPKKPPPLLIPTAGQLATPFSPTSNSATSSMIPPPLTITNNVLAASTGPTTTASPLSADELVSVWENFCKRKDKESMAKKTRKDSSKTERESLSSVWENFCKRKDKESMPKNTHKESSKTEREPEMPSMIPPPLSRERRRTRSPDKPAMPIRRFTESGGTSSRHIGREENTKERKKKSKKHRKRHHSEEEEQKRRKKAKKHHRKEKKSKKHRERD